MIRIRRIENISRLKWSYLIFQKCWFKQKKHFKTFLFKRILFFFGKSILLLHFGPVHFLITFYFVKLRFYK